MVCLLIQRTGKLRNSKTNENKSYFSSLISEHLKRRSISLINSTVATLDNSTDIFYVNMEIKRQQLRDQL
jgi:hypothetical protein